MSRDDTEDPASFPRPPLSFVDNEGREITVGNADPDADREALVDMYEAFDPADRAQGIPPAREPDVREWLDDLLVPEAVNVLAWHGDRVAGHATLVPDREAAYELAIFVHQEYQGAGIGSRLIRCLLGAAEEHGVERIWLTVERWNDAAIGLYRSVGFEATDAGGFEMEMERTLD